MQLGFLAHCRCSLHLYFGVLHDSCKGTKGKDAHAVAQGIPRYFISPLEGRVWRHQQAPGCSSIMVLDLFCKNVEPICGYAQIAAQTPFKVHTLSFSGILSWKATMGSLYFFFCQFWLLCSRLQAEDERDKNGSEDDDDDKPGKRVAGPRKKFHWDDTVRCGDTLLIYQFEK